MRIMLRRALGLAGIDVRSAGKHKNGLPDCPKTGLNLPFWTFTHETQLGAVWWPFVQSTGAMSPSPV